jgi:hypothetical protein
MRIRNLALYCLLAIEVASPILADGFKFKNGRISDEKTLVLRLTAAQAQELKKHFKPGYLLTLTEEQRAFINRSVVVKSPPTKVMIFKRQNLEGDCNCRMFNVGLLFKPDRIELPIGRIYSDKEVEEDTIE